MEIKRLDHVNLRTPQLGVMIDWYTAVLGMREGKRPDFQSVGAWLYVGDAPFVHLVSVEGMARAASDAPLTLEHFAFSAIGRAEFDALLNARGERYHQVEVPGFDLIQVNVWDPDGNHVHVDFPARE